MNARQMNNMMRRLGIQVRDIPDVQEVLIKTSEKVYTFRDAEVTLMDAQGQKTYQLTGKATVRDLTTAEKAQIVKTKAKPVPADETPDAEVGMSAEEQLSQVALEISDEDVAMVASQTGKSPKEARAALEATKGDLAEAILRLTK